MGRDNKLGETRVKAGSRWSPGRTGAACLALALVTLGVFWPVLRCGFVNYDDPVFVLQNPMIQQGLNLASLRWAFQSIYIYWQPLTWISYMLDYQLAGLSAAWFHGTNLILHTGSGIILFLALKRMTGAHWRSLMVAGLFALHPLHVETVAWVSERKGALSGFFYMLALYAYARHVERPRIGTMAWVGACFVLSLMAKSMAVTLPCVLLLLDFWPLKRWNGSRANEARARGGGPARPTRSLWQLVLEKAPLFGLAAISSALTIAAQRQMGAILSTNVFSTSDRLTMYLVSHLGYVRKLVWPMDLAVFYPIAGSWPRWEIAGGALLLAGVTAFCIWRAWRAPYLAVGWLMFLGMMLPVSGLLQTGEQLMADRYTYLPHIGLFIMVVWGVTDLVGASAPRRRVLAGSGAVGLALCAVLTARQIKTWRNTRALFEHANSVTRENYLAKTVLGTELMGERRYEEAIRLFEASLRIQPYYADTHYRMGLALQAQGNVKAAIEHLQTALKADPSNADVLAGLAGALRAGGQIEGAIQACEQLLVLRPKASAVLFELGSLLQARGRYPEAIARYREGLALNTSQPDAMNNLSWILATHADDRIRNGAEAVRWAELACKLTSRRVAVMLGTLAAAYAEAARFDEAIRTTEEAQAVAEQAGQPQLATRNAELREVYRSGKGWREAAP